MTPDPTPVNETPDVPEATDENGFTFADYKRYNAALRIQMDAQVDALTGELKGLREGFRQQMDTALNLRAENERLRALWPLNGFDKDTNVKQLIANHRAWTEQAQEDTAQARRALEGATGRAAEVREYIESWPGDSEYVAQIKRSVLEILASPATSEGTGEAP